MKCIDDPEFELYGNFESPDVNVLMVTFEKCDPQKRDDCKTEDEIIEWLEFKYIIVLENTKKFISHKFQEERIEQ